MGTPLLYNFGSPNGAGSNETPAEFEGHVAGVFQDLLRSAAALANIRNLWLQNIGS